MSFEEISDLLGQFAKLGMSRISLTGGEPLLFTSFTEVIALLNELGVRVNVNTNGLLVSENIEALSKVDSVSVSIDGPRLIHDKARGAGTFDRAAAGVQALVQAKIPVKIVSTLSSHNVGDPDALLQTPVALGAPLVVQPVWCQKLGSGEPVGDAPKPQQMHRAIERLLLLKKQGLPIANSYASLEHFYHWPHGKQIGCLAGQVTYRLEPDGRFTGCERMVRNIVWADLLQMTVDQALQKLPRSGCSQCWCAGQVELQLAANFNLRSLAGLVLGRQ
jgi:MoaA/NifB/PqqE/SkfB family radical SAM enzyme